MGELLGVIVLLLLILTPSLIERFQRRAIRALVEAESKRLEQSLGPQVRAIVQKAVVPRLDALRHENSVLREALDSLRRDLLSAAVLAETTGDADPETLDLEAAFTEVQRVDRSDLTVEEAVGQADPTPSDQRVPLADLTVGATETESAEAAEPDGPPAAHSAGGSPIESIGRPPEARASTGSPEPEAPNEAAAQPATPPAPARGATPTPRRSVETAIGLTWATRVGAGILLLGIIFFFKYAVEMAWIGPLSRVLAGAGLGLGLLSGAEVIARRENTNPTWIHATSGIGLSTLLVASWASYRLYSLTTAPIAFVLIGSLVGAGALLAVRHRSQPLLLTALAAGLANPILLTDARESAPLLFSYLIVLSALTLAVSVRMRWRLSAGLLIAGTSSIYVGWALRFFDPLGTYLAFWPRLLPLGAVVSLSALFGVAGQLWSHDRFRRGLLLASVAMAHVGSAIVLHDHPVWLGCSQALLAAVFAAAALRLKRGEFLLGPMVLSFVIMMLATMGLSGRSHMVGLLLLGVWLTTYGFVFSRPQQSEALTRRHQFGLGAAGTLFSLLTLVLLWPEDPLELASVFAALGVGVVALNRRQRHPAVMLVLMLVTGALMALMASAGGLADAGAPLMLAPASVWAAAYLVGVLLWLRRQDHLTATGTLLLLTPGVFYQALILLATTGPDLQVLKVVLSSAVAVVYLAVGLQLRRKERQGWGEWALVLAALAATIGAAQAFSEAVLVVVWAAGGAMLGWVSKRPNLGKLQHSSVLLLALAGYHLAVHVWPIPDLLRLLFIDSSGQMGSMAELPFVGARSIALLALGSALLFFGTFRPKLATSKLATTAGHATTAGWLALQAVLVLRLQLSDASTEIPTEFGFSRHVWPWLLVMGYALAVLVLARRRQSSVPDRGQAAEIHQLVAIGLVIVAVFRIVVHGYALGGEAMTVGKGGLIAGVLVFLVAIGAVLHDQHRKLADWMFFAAILVATTYVGRWAVGVTRTSIWAGMVVCSALAAKRTRSWPIFANASLLLGLTGLSFFVGDLHEPLRLRTYFIESMGSVGQFHSAVLGGPRTLGFLVLACASLAHAAALGSHRLKSTAQVNQRRIAAAIGTIGHVLMLGFVISAVWTLVDRSVWPPTGLGAEFDMSAEQAYLELAALSARRALFMTLCAGLYGGLLVCLGFWRRQPFHRWLGLALLTATVLKLALYDAWRLAKVYQMTIMVSVGAVLLASGFLYARYGDRLLQTERDEVDAS